MVVISIQLDAPPDGHMLDGLCVGDETAAGTSALFRMTELPPRYLAKSSIFKEPAVPGARVYIPSPIVAPK